MGNSRHHVRLRQCHRRAQVAAAADDVIRAVPTRSWTDRRPRPRPTAPPPPTFDQTLRALDDALERVATGYGVSGFMGHVHPEVDVRDAGTEAEERLAKWRVELPFREDVYRAVKAFAETPTADRAHRRAQAAARPLDARVPARGPGPRRRRPRPAARAPRPAGRARGRCSTATSPSTTTSSRSVARTSTACPRATSRASSPARSRTRSRSRSSTRTSSRSWTSAPAAGPARAARAPRVEQGGRGEPASPDRGDPGPAPDRVTARAFRRGRTTRWP